MIVGIGAHKHTESMYKHTANAHLRTHSTNPLHEYKRECKNTIRLQDKPCRILCTRAAAVRQKGPYTEAFTHTHTITLMHANNI